MTDIITINLGTAANTGTGDPLRSGGDKINQNFSALNAGKQETSPKLTTLANAVWAANQVQYQTGTGTISTFSTTAYGRSLVNLADGTALRNAAGAEPAITAGAATSFWSGTKAWVDFATTVRASILTGLSVATSTAITAADSVLSALGKLQAQMTATVGANSNITSLSGLTTPLSVGQGGTGGNTPSAARTSLGLGTAATANTQTSTSDATADRVMTIGAFGLGGSQGIAVPNNNLNDCSLNAVYNITGATTNAPSGASSGSSCLNVCWNGVVSGYQVVFAYTSNRMWFRRRNNSVWYDWEESVNASSIGTAATGTLTTSTTDNAAGRVLRVGDHGLGVSLGTMPAAGRLDALVAHSLFSSQDSAPPDWPTAQGQYPMGINFYRSAAVRAQLAMSYGIGAGVYWRVSGGSPFGNWARLFSQADILGTVSQSGGVPTGAIIERGSNANGNYVRFADGTQICWGTNNQYSDGVTQAASGHFVSPSGVTIIWPVPFYDNNVSLSSGISGATSYRAITLPYRSNASTGLITFQCYVSVPVGQVLTYHWMSIGRWYA